MEQQRGEMRRRGTNLANDRETRMKAPPPPRTDPAVGASFGPSVKQVSSMIGTRTQPRRKPSLEDSFDVECIELSDSDDELLLQPKSRSRQGSKEPRGSRAAANKMSSQDLPGSTVAFVIDGVKHKPHPDYQIDGKLKFQGMKFTKTKSPEEGTASSSSVTTENSSEPRKTLYSSSSTTRSTFRTKQDDTLHKAFRVPSFVNKDKIPASTSGPPRTRTRSRSGSPVASCDEPDIDQTPKPLRPRPRPKPVKKAEDTLSWGVLSAIEAFVPFNSEAEAVSEKGDEKGKGNAREWESWPMADMSPPKHSDGMHYSERDCPIDQLSPLKETSNERKEPRPFPLDNPPPSKGENANGEKQRTARSSSRPSQKFRPVQSFPELSPLSSPAKQPPSSSSVLESIGSPPAKRGSSDAEGSGGSTGRRGKKRARGADEILRELMHSDGMSDEDDDIPWDDPDFDPARLCSWCDELLPPEPSPHLQHLMSIARARSHSDSRPTNPLGLRAEPTVFVNVCQRHRFESHQIPLAKKRGWPTYVEWSKLAERVRRLEEHFRRIVDDMDEEFLPGQERSTDGNDGAEDLSADAKDDEDLLMSRPRKGSAFWREVVRSVKKRGARKAAGVRSQMTSFAKTQPGYYGELGSVIMSQTIYDLFPPVDFPPNSTLPLTPIEFIQHILVPEAALLLLMEDMHQSRTEALKTLRDSAQYGVAMFPDDHTEGNVASEAIVKARAAARRKEIERQDEQDEDVALWSTFPEDELGDAGAGRLSRASSVESTRPRRACAERAKPIVDSESDSDISIASTKSRSRKVRAKPASKTGGASRQTQRSKTPSVTSREPSIEILSGSDVPSRSSRPRPRLKAKVSSSTPHASDVDLSDGTLGMVDTQETPRPGKIQRGVVNGTSSSSFAVHDTKTGIKSSKKADADGWIHTLRGGDSSDES
ncbi:uncharacterized protein PHACADRAFT_214526 [Phanerochaete carnosa HHB-10118-sp]|uniref:Restriction of telomere capping protein 4 n=1 Tax=Phanerochaete carnosa (strain HHB-10118-sp) TaxID=650164 RepID=K5UHQ1_PHACS|nr:uncharacterized protein PHACADRAFT_214526 [Phanerochaete carnosa HHB-10118-sp]EKM49051.1 hypothetical protein PHACADRAFT_214526 [Phanerochaete carnosa HHB-10118-sp]